MGLLLVRHSDAIANSPGIDDFSRWLTLNGRQRAAQCAEKLRVRGVRCTRFLASPRVRAVQTAEIFAQALGFDGAVEILPALSYTAPAREAARALALLDGDTAAFGHMPTISEIAQLLSPGSHIESMGTAEALWIEAEAVAWSIRPED